jgi:hypothetical protein
LFKFAFGVLVVAAVLAEGVVQAVQKLVEPAAAAVLGLEIYLLPLV